MAAQQQMVTPSVDYVALVHTYFPPDQWDNALCVLNNLNNTRNALCIADPETCIAKVSGLYACYDWQIPQTAHVNGLWLINDVCWNPALAQTETPFTPDEWAQVLDPNVNTWMASVIWSIEGWKHFYVSQCYDTRPGPDLITGQTHALLTLTSGGPIPYPRHPLTTAQATGNAPPPNPPIGTAGLPIGLVAFGLVAAAGALAYLDARGGQF